MTVSDNYRRIDGRGARRIARTAPGIVRHVQTGDYHETHARSGNRNRPDGGARLGATAVHFDWY
ncbi:MAG: hypothetical protein AAF526_05825, partial [Pseudomonadota bacterium]